MVLLYFHLQTGRAVPVLRSSSPEHVSKRLSSGEAWLGEDLDPCLLSSLHAFGTGPAANGAPWYIWFLALFLGAKRVPGL